MTPPHRRVAVWSPGVPHPEHGASRVLFWHYLRALREADFDVLNVLMVEGPQDDPALAQYELQMRGPGFRVELAGADHFLERGRIRTRPDHAAVEPGRALTKAFRPDVTLALDLTCAWASKGLGIRRVVWLGDLNFETAWHHARYTAREDWKQHIRLPSAWMRARDWRRIYRDVLDGDVVITAAKSSEAALASIGVDAEYLPYPWPAPGEFASPVEWEPPPVPTFLFLGTLFALGSRSAFHMLLEEVYPRLITEIGKFEILVAGHGDPPAWARNAIAGMPEVRYLGYVEDLVSLFRRIHGVLAPIDIPVGNRSRILTAMAGGALVIAHESAALGNPALVDGRTCYLAKDATSFVDRMKRALDDRRSAATIINAARSAFEENFEPAVASRLLVQKLTEAIHSPIREGQN